MFDRYTLAQIEAMPTIRQSHTDDLKKEIHTVRVWLSRLTIKDGMPYDNQIVVEELRNGQWVTMDVYKPL